LKALTKNQKSTLRTLKHRFAVHFDKGYPADSKLLAYTHVKKEWQANGSREGINRDLLDALEKKGMITCESTYDRRTGQFNPVADSWGYSIVVINVYVKLTGKGRVERC